MRVKGLDDCIAVSYDSAVFVTNSAASVTNMAALTALAFPF
jgi:hypothetical protein